MEFIPAVYAINDQWPLFWPLVGALLGGVIGSFIGCVEYRLPRGESISSPPSQCPHCHFRLQVVDLIPVFSFLLLRGKCRKCAVKIPLRTWLIETVCAVIGFIVVFWLFSA